MFPYVTGCVTTEKINFFVPQFFLLYNGSIRHKNQSVIRVIWRIKYLMMLTIVLKLCWYLYSKFYISIALQLNV